MMDIKLILIGLSSFFAINNIFSLDCCGGKKEKVIEFSLENTTQIVDLINSKEITKNDINEAINFVNGLVKKTDRKNLLEVKKMIDATLMKKTDSSKISKMLKILKYVYMSFNGEKVYVSKESSYLINHYESAKRCTLWTEDCIIEEADADVVLLIAHCAEEEKVISFTTCKLSN